MNYFTLQLYLNRYMKTTNQFDYPTASATTYKAYKPQTAPQDDSKERYQKIIKEASNKERQKVQLQLQRKKQLSASQQQQYLAKQLERKKKELDELQRLRKEAIEQQIKAAELAKIKEQQDQIKRIEQDERMKIYDDNANFRFKDALRRLQNEKQQQNYRERQAQQRRKVNQQVQKQQREKAGKYKMYLKEKEQEERQRELDEQRKNQQLYKNGMIKHGIAKNIDYSKTCFHNPKMVFSHSENERPSALQRAQQQAQKRQQISANRKDREQQDRQKSLQRGNRALERNSRERQYRQYLRQTQQQQRRYNLKRIQSGKRDQLTGLKPLTLAQMQLNKKQRGQQEFEQMFTPNQILDSTPATKYTIVQTKYNPARHYNQSPQTANHSDQDDHSDSDIQQRKIQVIPQRIQPIIEKRRMAETRAEEPTQKQQLSYSQSQDDSSYI